MRKLVMLLVIVIPFSVLAKQPEVVIKTNKGDIVVELFSEASPKTVHNFLSYVDANAYEGIVFHRVIKGFMIQTGGYYQNLSAADAGAAITNEADNGLLNRRGTLSMARMNAIDSASRQFFINTVDNRSLDHSDNSCDRDDEARQIERRARGLHKPQTCRTFGYAVFGKVTSGMDVVDLIEGVQTGSLQGFVDIPVEAVVIHTISRVVEPLIMEDSNESHLLSQ